MQAATQHVWAQDGHDSIGNAVEKCGTGSCTVRKIENCATFWQRAKRGRWYDEENEAIPPCTGVAPKRKHTPAEGFFSP